eukprot:TRINITY_DN10303_c0_g1_i1.p1 TRINITY_DN10303_c0_g1~~TRINITY_DN10303_c0_g1_i1.p1  ORF type:complete len:212 (-),score=36.77 TRINITY_DN10303_c0_g1_i1:175-810(-)
MEEDPYSQDNKIIQAERQEEIERQKRSQFLMNAASAFGLGSSMAAMFIADVRDLGYQTNTNVESSLRKKFCIGCHHLLVPGQNCVVSIKKGPYLRALRRQQKRRNVGVGERLKNAIVTRCLNCGHTRVAQGTRRDVKTSQVPVAKTRPSSSTSTVINAFTKPPTKVVKTPPQKTTSNRPASAFQQMQQKKSQQQQKKQNQKTAINSFLSTL